MNMQFFCLKPPGFSHWLVKMNLIKFSSLILGKIQNLDEFHIQQDRDIYDVDNKTVFWASKPLWKHYHGIQVQDITISLSTRELTVNWKEKTEMKKCHFSIRCIWKIETKNEDSSEMALYHILLHFTLNFIN